MKMPQEHLHLSLAVPFKSEKKWQKEQYRHNFSKLVVIHSWKKNQQLHNLLDIEDFFFKKVLVLQIILYVYYVSGSTP